MKKDSPKGGYLLLVALTLALSMPLAVGYALQAHTVKTTQHAQAALR